MWQALIEYCYPFFSLSAEKSHSPEKRASELLHTTRKTKQVYRKFALVGTYLSMHNALLHESCIPNLWSQSSAGFSPVIVTYRASDPLIKS